MNDYILNITLAKGSGEYCICVCFSPFHLAPLVTFHIAHILAPFAHARLPIVDRIAAVKCPVAFACESRSLAKRIFYLTHSLSQMVIMIG